MRKTWIMAAVFSLAVALHVGVVQKGFAGEPGEQGDRQERRIDAISQRLKLSDAQKKIVDSAFEDRREKMKALHEDFMSRKKAIDDETDGKISAALNDKQKADFARMKDERGKRRDDAKGHRKERRGEPESH